MRSTEFVKERIKMGLANVSLQNDAKFSELKFDEYIKTHTSEEFQKKFVDNKCSLKHENVITMIDGQKVTGDVIVDVIYDENADFEYFTTERCTCDGTFIFMGELIEDVFLKVINIQTTNNEKVPDGFIKNIFDYEIVYTVGNFVLCYEDGDFGTEEKPWLYSRFTVMLPIKFDIVKKNKGE